MRFFDAQANFNKEKQELNRQIMKLNDDIKFIKNMGEDILVIHKVRGEVNNLEFKVKEKQAMSDIISTANDIIKKNEILKDINQELKSTLDKSSQLIEQLKEENKRQEDEIKSLKNRNIFKRIFNKK
jgi:uncharacterized protein YukE